MKVQVIILLVSLILFAKASSSSAATTATAANGGGTATASSAAVASSNGVNNRGAAAASAAAVSNGQNGGSAASSSAAATSGDSSAVSSATAAVGDNTTTSTTGDNTVGDASASTTPATSSSANGGSSNINTLQQSKQKTGTGIQIGRKSSQINCADGEFLYQNVCMKKSCLTNKLSRIHLNPIDSTNGTVGTLDTGIRGDIRVIRDQGNIIYQIKVSYHDEYNNQILSDRQNCVDYRLYQTANSYDIDPTRLGVSGTDSIIPSYPVSYYTFSQQSSAGMVGFNMSQSELEKKCLKYTSKSQQTTTWECYYEFAFVVQQVTQVSYYFCVRVQLNNMVADSLPAVDFQKIVQYDRCSNSGPCTVNVNIDSSLYFCRDRKCQEISLTPYYVLFLNRPFQMKYQIDSPSFKNYYIYNETVTYQSEGFSLKLSEQDQEVTIISRQPGWNAIELRVPIVAEQVIISISGSVSQTISQNSRILQPISPDGVTQKNVQSHASIPAGAVVEPNADVIKTQQQQINSPKKSSEALTLAIGVALLVAALLH